MISSTSNTTFGRPKGPTDDAYRDLQERLKLATKEATGQLAEKIIETEAAKNECVNAHLIVV